MEPFATVQDVIALWRPLQPDEVTRADALLPLISNEIRLKAEQYGVDIDAKASSSEVYASVLKSVIIDTVTRIMRTPVDAPAMSTMSESALGYSVSGTYLVPGGGAIVLDRDLKRLGIYKSQRIGVIEPYGTDYHAELEWWRMTDGDT